MEQMDLFPPEEKPDAKALREEEFFGKMDAQTGLGLRNGYSGKLSGQGLAAYERAWRATRAVMLAAAVAGCSFAPGSAVVTYIHAEGGSCTIVYTSTVGNPAGGTATTDLKIPSPATGGLGLSAARAATTDETAATPPGQSCSARTTMQADAPAKLGAVP